MKLKIIILGLFASVQIMGQTDRMIDHTNTDIHGIPLEWIDSAQAKLHIVYFRASHGSQLTDGGMTALVNYSEEYASTYAYSSGGQDGALHLVEFAADLQHENATWVSMTEEYLDAHPECNVAMWAHCDIYEVDVEQYLSDMEMLISRYGPGGSENREHPVTFVFMNGHTSPWNGQGIAEAVYYSNMRIREYCLENNRWFYDFYDMECYDPDGNYFGDGNSAGEYTGEHRLRWDVSYDQEGGGRGNWGIEWMSANPESELTELAADGNCVSCQHSEGVEADDNSRLQCVLKGNAAWWLWARLAGWTNV